MSDKIQRRILEDLAEIARWQLEQQRQRKEFQNNVDGRPKCSDSDDFDPLLEALKIHHVVSKK